MTKTISAPDMSASLDTAIDWVRDNPEPLVLERDGQPQAVLLPFEEYEQLQALKEEARRQAGLVQLWQLAARVRQQPPPPKPPLSPEEQEALWNQLEALREEVSARNTDLTDEEIEALADEITHDAIQSLIDKGEIRFSS